MRDIPPEKFDANAMGNVRQDEPRMRRRVKHVDLPIGRVCPERAEAYGLDYERWQRSYNAALDVDLREIQKAGTMWYHRLARGEKVRITSDVGTSLTFEPNAARLMVDDGIISASDVRHGFVETSLPAGKIVSAVRSGSAEGEVHFADAVFMMGQTVRGLRFKFEKGRLLEWSAEEHGDLLASLLKHKETSGNRMGWFSIGLNQEAEPCMLDNSIVHDDVGIGLGPHSVLERPKAKMSVQFEATIGPASVEIFD